MQIMSLDYSDYVGRIGIGRVYRGTLDLQTPLRIVKRDGTSQPVQIKQLLTFEGLQRQPADSVPCGDLCAVSGIDDIDIGDTLADAEHPEALPPISIDEPTMSMMFKVNDSPFFGRESKYSTSRHLRERLSREVERDVAISVEEIQGEVFKVNGRGVLHLSILLENMRREGYEMTVSQPHVIFHTENGKKLEPVEVLTIDTPETYVGRVIEIVGQRRGTMTHMEHNRARRFLEFNIPTRGTIGLRSKILTATAGEAIISHRFLHYAPYAGEIAQRTSGVLISMAAGKAMAYAIDALQQRGTFFIDPGTEAYEGMIVGEHCIESDLVVNIQKGKQLTNMRAAGSDRNLKIAPAAKLSLEEALEYINDDELVEVTPRSIRLRKKFLKEHERKRIRKSDLQLTAS
jgi:GTP-binding protein